MFSMEYVLYSYNYYFNLLIASTHAKAHKFIIQYQKVR